MSFGRWWDEARELVYNHHRWRSHWRSDAWAPTNVLVSLDWLVVMANRKTSDT